MKPRDVESGLTAGLLRSVVRYKRLTGEFFHKGTGDRCGWLEKDGYVRIKLFGRNYLAHRLAWLFVTGAWPEDRLDHKDGDRGNNRFANLRPCSDRQNSGNKKLRCDSTSRCKGVRRHIWGRWSARIGIPGTASSAHLGMFSTKTEASAAYLRAAKQQFKEFARAA